MSVKVVLVDTIMSCALRFVTKYDCAKPLQGMETELVVAYFTVLLQL